jgi:hypothetical protein
LHLCVESASEYVNKEKDLVLKSKTNTLINNLIKDKRNSSQSWSCAPVGKDYKSNIEMNGLFTGISGISNTLLNFVDYEKTVKLFQ